MWRTFFKVLVKGPDKRAHLNPLSGDDAVRGINRDCLALETEPPLAYIHDNFLGKNELPITVDSENVPCFLNGGKGVTLKRKVAPDVKIQRAMIDVTNMRLVLGILRASGEADKEEGKQRPGETHIHVFLSQ
jgi:hypothetical protein